MHQFSAAASLALLQQLRLIGQHLQKKPAASNKNRNVAETRSKVALYRPVCELCTCMQHRSAIISDAIDLDNSAASCTCMFFSPKIK